MTGRLADKVAIVTGAASGIGAATARVFFEEGASVIVADIQPISDADLLRAAEKEQSRLVFEHCDVRSEDDIVRTVGRAISDFGKLNIAVANAAVTGQGRDVDISVEHWDLTMDVNVKGVFLLTKHSVPAMIAAGGGSIINISSAYGVIGAPSFAAYCASKGAVRNFTKATAIEHAASKVRANSIHPGVIETPMLQGMIDRAPDPVQARAMFDGLQPSGSTGAPEDIAWGCVYLASDESKFVSGAELYIDGGLLAR